MRALARELLEEFDEEHFDTQRKRHVADLMAVLAGTSTHDFSQPPAAKADGLGATRSRHALAARSIPTWRRPCQ
jgi:hypothetical protein